MPKLLINLNKGNKLLSIFLFCLYQLIFVLQINAQTISVNGKVTSSRFPVQNALVSFIDNSDTSIAYSSITDSSGKYNLSLIITSIKENIHQPHSFLLEQNYPNPFSTLTDIPYQLKKQSDVEVTIYDILGRQIKKFSLGVQPRGRYQVLWDGRNNFGEKVAAGIYLYQLRAGTETQVKKMVFGTGGKNFIPSPIEISPSLAQINKNLDENITNNSFKVRIENTDSTFPSIIVKEFDNVLIQNDTTIDFSVDAQPIATINLDSMYQHISGFGAANILQWRPDMTDSEIETAFDTGNGQLGFTILRLRIQPDSNQWSTNIPTAKKAYDMGVKIIASPWSPPASMKTNNNLVGGELKETSYSDYAAHLNSFVEYMSNNGVPIYAVSVQNEPDISVNYESCDWNASQMKKFVKENGASIGTKVIVPESFNFNHTISDSILDDPTAAANVAIIGGHIYGGGLGPYPLAEEKGKEVWMTEHLTESSHSANVWLYALQVGIEMQRVMEANMSAYIWWYIVRYYGPIGDGESSTSFPNEEFSEKGEVTKKGYVMSQFARFIRPGFYRVKSGVDLSLSNVEITAYKDPSSSKIVIVAINSGSTQVQNLFRIQNETMVTIFTPYTTSESKNCEQGNEVTTANGSFTYTLEPSSITTFVSE